MMSMKEIQECVDKVVIDSFDGVIELIGYIQDQVAYRFKEAYIDCTGERRFIEANE